MNIEIEDFVATFHPLMNQIADPLFVLDLKGDIIYSSQAAEKLAGFSEIDFVSDFVKQNLPSFNKNFKATNDVWELKGKSFQFKRFCHPNDKKHSYSAGFMPLMNNHFENYGWVLMLKSKDLMGDREIENLQINSFLSCLNNLNKDACVVQRFDTGEIVFVSDSFRNVSGWCKEEMMKGGILFYFMLMNNAGKNYVSLIAELLKGQNKHQIEKTAHTPLKLSTVFRKKNDALIQINVTTSLISLPENPGVYYGISFINEIKEEIKYYPLRNAIRNMPLTNREGEIVSLLAKGYSSKMIADKHTLKEGYVSQIRKRLLKKFNVNNSPELVQLLNAEGYL